MAQVTGTATKILDGIFKIIPKEILVTYLSGYLMDFTVNSIKNPNSKEAKLIIPELQALKDSLNKAPYLK